MKKYILYFLIFTSLLIVTVCALLLYESQRFARTQISFLDIGQGDATLISEGSYQILIDGGPDGRKLLEEVGRQMPFWDRTIELVIATHPDSDHIDGLVDLVQNYSVTEFWGVQIERDTSVFAALERNLRNRHVRVRHPERGWKVTLPSGASLDVIYPFVADDVVAFADEPNNASISAIFTAGTDKFFLAGDLHKEVEELLPVSDEITVLKASHHGSSTSTSQTLLNRLTPRDVVISAGRGNRYNHPRDEVVSRVEKSVENIYRTDLDGTIHYECTDLCVVYR